MDVFADARVVTSSSSRPETDEQWMYHWMDAARRRMVAGQKKAAIRELRKVMELLIEETDVYMGVWGDC